VLEEAAAELLELVYRDQYSAAEDVESVTLNRDEFSLADILPNVAPGDAPNLHLALTGFEDQGDGGRRRLNLRVSWESELHLTKKPGRERPLDGRDLL
jgi:hypothetical protein